jgi:hypothetical protein
MMDIQNNVTRIGRGTRQISGPVPGVRGWTGENSWPFLERSRRLNDSIVAWEEAERVKERQVETTEANVWRNGEVDRNCAGKDVARTPRGNLTRSPTSSMNPHSREGCFQAGKKTGVIADPQE